MKKIKLLKFYWVKLLAILFFFLLLGAYFRIFALGLYTPGETLDPTCSPGTPNCTVNLNTISYPAVGIPTSTGSSWGTSIIDHSSDWNMAYSWGNHANEGYVTGSPWTSEGYIKDGNIGWDNSYGFLTIETDPSFSTSTAHGITVTDVSNWNDKQSALTSGLNIKTINSNSVLGSGDILIPTSPITIANSYSLFSTGLSVNGGTGTRSIANNSIFFGVASGFEATNADYSNFIGGNAGYRATNSYLSNFLGYQTGMGASLAYQSNFIGMRAGYNASHAANSIFIGNSAGDGDSVNNTTDYGDGSELFDASILIGNYTRTGGHSNSIALGAYAINTMPNQFVIGSDMRPIDTTITYGSGGTECTLTTGIGLSCTSDERLKTNVTDLNNNILEKLIKIRTVNFNWKKGNVTSNNIGFLAQDLEQYFPEMIATNTDGYKSVYYASMTPILTEAIRELDLKVKEFSERDYLDSISVLPTFKNYLENLSNGLEVVFFGEVRAKRLCLEDLCLSKNQLEQLLKNIENPNVVDSPETPTFSNIDTLPNPDNINISEVTGPEITIPASPTMQESTYDSIENLVD